MTAHRCHCGRLASPGRSLCTDHLPATVDVEYEAARLDPTTDRERWDVWDDGGLERPGGDDEWD